MMIMIMIILIKNNKTLLQLHNSYFQIKKAKRTFELLLLLLLLLHF